MPIFELRRILFINGEVNFYQLVIDGILMLDAYEKRLGKKDKKDLKTIFSYMDLVANNEHVPGNKYHELQDRPKGDNVKDFEFKKNNLRVYGFKTFDGKVIALGGFKNAKQNADISKLRSIKNKYIETIKNNK